MTSNAESPGRFPNRAMRPPETVQGPLPLTPADIGKVNHVFSEAFTDRYQRDGLSGVRVPPLNPAIWKFAIAAAGEGAMQWRDGAGQVVAFNLVHACGSEGWMGPLAVRPGRQGEGIGAQIVETGIRWLRRSGARVIGLETMPRTVENIGFYSRLGFRPEHLTVSMTKDFSGPSSAPGGTLLSRVATEGALQSCRGLTQAVAPGLDFSREIALTRDFGIGDTTMVEDGRGLAGFALWHSAPLAEGKPDDELRVLKLIARDNSSFRRVLQAVETAGWSRGVRRIAIRCQTAYREAYGSLLDAGYRVHWTDLRMTLNGMAEPVTADGAVVFSNWEI
jgi:GNAT superfamily N-acetyltransferase